MAWQQKTHIMHCPQIWELTWLAEYRSWYPDERTQNSHSYITVRVNTTQSAYRTPRDTGNATDSKKHSLLARDWCWHWRLCLQMPSLFSYKTIQQMRTALQHAISDDPWLKIGADIFELDRKKYLHVIDYFSVYPFKSKMRLTAVEATINKLKDIFPIEGSPQTSHWQWSPTQ